MSNPQPPPDEPFAAILGAALHLLDNVTPFHSSLEVEYHADGVELFGDLAEAMGLPRDYGSDSWRERMAEAERES